MDVVRDRDSSVLAVVLVPVLAVLLWDLPLNEEVLICDAELRGGTMIFGDRTPSADCHAIVSGLPLYTEPSDTA